MKKTTRIKTLFLVLYTLLSITGYSQTDSSAVVEIFTVVEEMPQFPGGEAEKIKFIKNNLAFPESAIKNKTYGKCFTKFTVMKDGSIKDIIILKGVLNCPDCDKEAINVLTKMPKWIPGRQNGHLVNVYSVLPINFTH